jgi:hypothetical protein
LIAYLKRIEADRDPGLTEQRYGWHDPAERRRVRRDRRAMKEVLTAYFANINDKGGIYNRRIELQTIDAQSDAAATAANMKMHVDNGELFALVSGLSAGADKELAAVDERRRNTARRTGDAAHAGQCSGESQPLLPVAGLRVNKHARSLTSPPGKPELKKSPPGNRLL